jgi:hypothetical protein
MAKAAANTPSDTESTSAEAASLAPLRSGWLHILLVDVLPYVVLYLLAIWLVSATTTAPGQAAHRWQLFIPVVGLVATFGGWHRAGPGAKDKAWFLLQQVLHWGTLAIVVQLLFLTSMRHFLDLQSDAFILIYLLGLTSVLSGIYLDWNMAGFGVFLIASAIVYGYVVDHLKILVSISGIAVATIVLVFLLSAKFGQRRRS